MRSLLPSSTQGGSLRSVPAQHSEQEPSGMVVVVRRVEPQDWLGWEEPDLLLVVPLVELTGLA